MAIERSGIKLGENIYLGYVTVQAIADGNINEPIIRPQGNRRLRPLLGKRVEPRACSTSQNNPKNTLHREDRKPKQPRPLETSQNPNKTQEGLEGETDPAGVGVQTCLRIPGVGNSLGRYDHGSPAVGTQRRFPGDLVAGNSRGKGEGAM